MSKYFVVGVFVLLIAVAGYLLFRGGPAKAPVKPKVEKVGKRPTERRGPVRATVSKPVEEAEEASAPSPEKKEMAVQSEAEMATPAPEEDDAEKGEAEVEDEKPTVRRSRLIGGADVEWIEPKEREGDDKFGPPPGL